MYQGKVVEEIKAQTLSSVTFFFRKCSFYEIMLNNIVERFRPRDIVAHAHCMLDN
jgi:hypothetical protein